MEKIHDFKKVTVQKTEPQRQQQCACLVPPAWQACQCLGECVRLSVRINSRLSGDKCSAHVAASSLSVLVSEVYVPEPVPASLLTYSISFSLTLPPATPTLNQQPLGVTDGKQYLSFRFSCETAKFKNSRDKFKYLEKVRVIVHKYVCAGVRYCWTGEWEPEQD